MILTRDDFKDYCLRRLGFPVVQINVDEDQVEDRVNDALQFWNEYHFDGTQRVYLKGQIVASTLTLQTAVNASFIHNEPIIGQTSKATARVQQIMPDNLTLQLHHTVGTFVNGEILTGVQSGFSANLATANAFVLGNWDKGYIDTTDAITGVRRIFQVGTGSTGGAANNIFDVVYQFRLTDMYDLMSTDLTYYAQMKQHLEMLDMILPGQRSFRFNRKQNRIYLDLDWYTVFSPGQFVIAECYAIVDPADFAKVYDDMFLKKYATALIKRQWGTNMYKFKNVQLPGGVMLNGVELYAEADKEIQQIEKDMKLAYEIPPSMMVG